MSNIDRLMLSLKINKKTRDAYYKANNMTGFMEETFIIIGKIQLARSLEIITDSQYNFIYDKVMKEVKYI